MVSALGQADCKEERVSGTAHSGLSISFSITEVCQVLMFHEVISDPTCSRPKHGADLEVRKPQALLGHRSFKFPESSSYELLYIRLF